MAATLDDLMGEFNGGRTAADGCREQQLLVVILQEANAPLHPRRAPIETIARLSSLRARGRVQAVLDVILKSSF